MRLVSSWKSIQVSQNLSSSLSLCVHSLHAPPCCCLEGRITIRRQPIPLCTSSSTTAFVLQPPVRKSAHSQVAISSKWLPELPSGRNPFQHTASTSPYLRSNATSRSQQISAPRCGTSRLSSTKFSQLSSHGLSSADGLSFLPPYF